MRAQICMVLLMFLAWIVLSLIRDYLSLRKDRS
jgi:hypothetical protein